jgi:hypothetical protein
MNQGRLIGIILIVIGFGIAMLTGLFLASQVSADDEGLSAGGAIVGAALAFIPVSIFVGFGIYLYVRGGQEAEEESVIRKQRELLDIVKSRGEVEIHSLALEMNTNVDQVKSMVHQLVGLQVFSGYINWDDGTLYSDQASSLRELDQCKKCGGDIKLAGKGVVVCPYCGTEYFLS